MDPVQGLSGVDVGRAFERAAEPGGQVQNLATRFSDLLAKEPPSHTVPEVGAPTVVSHLVGEHERMYHGLIKDLARASVASQHMMPQEATLKQVELMFRVVNVSMQNNACVYVAQSSKNGLQTLMKNQ
jgi:type III secretion inner rod protein HrpB2